MSPSIFLEIKNYKTVTVRLIRILNIYNMEK
jgi:hypothetical protein